MAKLIVLIFLTITVQNVFAGLQCASILQTETIFVTMDSSRLQLENRRQAIEAQLVQELGLSLDISFLESSLANQGDSLKSIFNQMQGHANLRLLSDFAKDKILQISRPMVFRPKQALFFGLYIDSAEGNLGLPDATHIALQEALNLYIIEIALIKTKKRLKAEPDYLKINTKEVTDFLSKFESLLTRPVPYEPFKRSALSQNIVHAQIHSIDELLARPVWFPSLNLNQ